MPPSRTIRETFGRAASYRPYSSFTPTVLMIFDHIAFSSRMILASAAAVLPTVSDPETSTVYVPTFFKNGVIAYTLQ